MTLTAQQQAAAFAAVEPCLMEAQLRLIAAGFRPEAGMLTMIVTPLSGSNFETISSRVWEIGDGQFLDWAIKKSLADIPTAKLDEERIRAGKSGLVAVQRPAPVLVIDRLLRDAAERYPSLDGAARAFVARYDALLA